MLWDFACFGKKFYPSSTTRVRWFNNPKFVFAFTLFSFLLKLLVVLRQNPRFRYYRILGPKIPYLLGYVSVHQIFAAKMPSSSKMIAMFILVKVFKLFCFQRRRPKNIPLRVFTLTETGPGECIYDTVVRVNIVCDLKLHFIRFIIHLCYRVFKGW